ncbi:MAG: hypothetical protein V1755_13625 [Chloroflexota bacterium]
MAKKACPLNKARIIREVSKGLDAQFEMFPWEKVIEYCALTKAEKVWARKHLTYKLVEV